MSEEPEEPQEEKDESAEETSEETNQDIPSLLDRKDTQESTEETSEEPKQEEQESIKDNEESAMPEGWPEDLWDTEKNAPKLEDTLERLNKAQKNAEDLRKKLSTKDSKEVEVPEEYEFEALTKEGAQDSLDKESIDIFKNASKSAKLSNEQANEILNTYIEGSKEIIQKQKEAELEKLGEHKEKVLGSIQNYLNAKVNNNTFSEHEANALGAAIKTAEGARALSKIIMQTGEKSIPTESRYVGDHKTIKDIQSEMTEAIRAKDNKRVERLRQELNKLSR